MGRPRLYADVNGMQMSPRNPRRGCLSLHYHGTLADLSRLQIALSEGMSVTVYCDSQEGEDLEADAVVYYDRSKRHWFAELEEEGFRYVPAPNQWAVRSFPCASCRTDLAPQIAARGLKLDDRCPLCRSAIHAPIAPPPQLAGSWSRAVTIWWPLALLVSMVAVTAVAGSRQDFYVAVVSAALAQLGVLRVWHWALSRSWPMVEAVFEPADPALGVRDLQLVYTFDGATYSRSASTQGPVGSWVSLKVDPSDPSRSSLVLPRPDLGIAVLALSASSLVTAVLHAITA